MSCRRTPGPEACLVGFLANEVPRGNSSVKSSVTNCVMAKLKTWQLPPARAVTFPFFIESLGT